MSAGEHPKMGLVVSDLSVRYGAVTAVRQASFTVAPGQVAALIGPNGAGKSSTIRAIAGVAPSRGCIQFRGVNLQGASPRLRAELGISTVPEGRALFPGLSVEDNLKLGLLPLRRRRRVAMDARLEVAYSLFPILKERHGQLAGTLSGGQQQMLAVARALIPGCRLLVLDEPSLGLAPLVVDEVYHVLSQVKESGVAVLVVEQFVRKALGLADVAYVMARGQVVLARDAAQLRALPSDVLDAYLGTRGQATGRKDAAGAGVTLGGGTDASSAMTATAVPRPSRA